MEGTPTFSTSLYNTACDCVRFQQRRKCTYDSDTCQKCDFYIKNYMYVDSAQANLFMLEARRHVNASKPHNVHRPVFAAIAAACLVMGIAGSYRSYQIKQSVQPTAVVPKSVEQPKVSSDAMIKDTLYKVADRLEAKDNIYPDGKINCIDAAIWFYSLYPNKDDVQIVINQHAMDHLFNAVKLNGTWVKIEPQAFVKPAWDTYLMSTIWSKQYNPMYDVDETKKWRVYAK